MPAILELPEVRQRVSTLTVEEYHRLDEYWIVLGTTQQVETYRQPAGDRYRERVLLSGADPLECAGLPGIRLRVGDLFA